MKIIDQTPFFKEDGTLSLADRTRAIMKFGTGWIKEVEAQKPVIAVLERNLDKKFTLLRNITLAGMDTMIPFILVGPPGLFVMWVASQEGMFSARGDQWGTISGGSIHPVSPNLLTRTERMSRAVQIYLKRQGFNEMTFVEPILLCSDPTTHVDSVRPLIRVVMRDALERFAVSLSQGRVTLSAEGIFDIVNRLLNPAPPPKLVDVAAAGAGASAGAAAADAAGVASEAAMETAPVDPDATLPGVTAAASTPQEEPALPDWLIQPAAPPEAAAQTTPPEAGSFITPLEEPPVVPRRGFSRRQWILLAVMLAIWVLLMAVFAFLVLRDFPLTGLTR